MIGSPPPAGPRIEAPSARRSDLQIKFRERFRPFAPVVLRERVSEGFELDSDSPYMLIVAPVAEKQRLPTPSDLPSGIDRLKVPQSTIPAVTHVDGSARVQTVDANEHPRFHALLAEFERLTGCPVIIKGLPPRCAIVPIGT